MKTVSKQDTNPSVPTTYKTFFVIGFWVLHYIRLPCERDSEMTEPNEGKIVCYEKLNIKDNSSACND